MKKIFKTTVVLFTSLLVTSYTIIPSKSGFKRKMALVIGNGDYENVTSLKNPKHDAEDIAIALEKNGFVVTKLINANSSKFSTELASFKKEFDKNGSLGLIYYSGHSICSSQEFLAPTDTKPSETAMELIPISDLLGERSNAKPLIVILDTSRYCFNKGREDDIKPKLKNDNYFSIPENSMLIYSTKRCGTSSEGEHNGVFTEELLKWIDVKDLKIEDVFRKIIVGVRNKTNNSQLPIFESTLFEEIYLAGQKETNTTR